MSKKKEEKSVEEEEVKKKELKEKIKKPSKKTSKQDDEVKEDKVELEFNSNLPLKALIDLVTESNLRRKDIIVLLGKNGYLGQFYEEEDKRLNGLYVEPTITEQEFKKIIGE